MPEKTVKELELASPELDQLIELNNRLGLVPKGDTEEERDRNCALFTRAGAWALRADGWGNIRKTEGHQIDGLDVDKILNRRTSQASDIIRRASAPDAAVAWQPFDGTGILERWVAPREPFNGGEDGPIEPDAIVEALIGIDEQLDRIGDALRDQANELHKITALLERLAERWGV